MKLKRKIYNHGFYDYYYKCQNCDCESVSLKNKGGFQPPDLICDNCGVMVINTKIEDHKEIPSICTEEFNDLCDHLFSGNPNKQQVDFVLLQKDLKFFRQNDEVKGYFGKKGSENILLFFELLSKYSSFAHKAHKELNRLNNK